MSEQCSNTGIYIGLAVLVIGLIAIFYKVNNVDQIVMRQYGPMTPPVVVVAPSAVARDPVPSRGASIPLMKPEEPKASPSKDTVAVAMMTDSKDTKPIAATAPASTQLPPASPAASTATAQVAAAIKAAEKFRF